LKSGSVATAFRYVFSGGTAAVVDIGGFRLLTWLGVPVVVAAACSFAAAVLVNYALTSRWVFGAAINGRRFSAFVAGACVGVLVNVAITSAGIFLFHIPHIIAKTIAVSLTMILNVWINSRFVFREPVVVIRGEVD
jgi:putative flippase GtrA